MSAFQQLVSGGLPMTVLQDRALTKGWALVRRARATLNMTSPEDLTPAIYDLTNDK
jgi:hypothetical protein